MICVVEEGFELEGALAGFHDNGKAVECATVDYKRLSTNYRRN